MAYAQISERSGSPSVFGYSSPAGYLQALLRHRGAGNPAYGANAFARQIGVSASTLSMLFAGKRVLSRAMGEKIAARLGLKTYEEEFFLGLIEFSLAKTESARRKTRQILTQLKPRKTPRRVSAEHAIPIGQWTTLALLEIAFLEPLHPDRFGSLARRLGVSVGEIRSSVNVLHSANLLFTDASGAFRRPSGEVQLSLATAKSEVDDYHRQHLRRASENVGDSELENRVFASNFLTFARSDLEQVRKCVYRMLDDLHDLSLNSPKTDAVYALALGMFSVFEKGENQ